MNDEKGMISMEPTLQSEEKNSGGIKNHEGQGIPITLCAAGILMILLFCTYIHCCFNNGISQVSFSMEPIAEGSLIPNEADIQQDAEGIADEAGRTASSSKATGTMHGTYLLYDADKNTITVDATSLFAQRTLLCTLFLLGGIFLCAFGGMLCMKKKHATKQISDIRKNLAIAKQDIETLSNQQGELESKVGSMEQQFTSTQEASSTIRLDRFPG